MFTTKVLRQAAAHAERTPSIRFIGKRTIPGMSDLSARTSALKPTRPKLT
jgi:hypothetical protein